MVNRNAQKENGGHQQSNAYSRSLETLADRYQEQHGCQRDGYSHVLVGVLPGSGALLEDAALRPGATGKFYQVTTRALEMNKLNRELRQWGNIYNTVCAQQALVYLTPQQFLRQSSSLRKE
jgi:hypothetical protein